MNVTFENFGDLTGKISVKVSENDYAEEFKKQLKKIGANRQFPGFRKGHVPYAQLLRMFGKEVKSDVINNEVYKAVIEYIRNEKLNILGEPLPIEVKEISLEDKDYDFEYEVGLSPEINVDLQSETIPFYTIKVTDEMADERDKALRDRFGAQVPGEEFEPNSLVKGAIMELNADGSIKETEDAIQVVDGIVAPMYFTDKEQAALFEGKKVGDKVVFNPSKTCGGNATELSSMLHIDKDKAADVKADFELAISEIIVLRPAEHGQEFYDEVFGKDKVADEAAYNEALRSAIAHELAPNSDGLFRLQAEKDIIAKSGNFNLPDTFLKKWLVARNEELTAENIDEEYNKMLPGLKWELIKGKLLSDLKIEVNEEDLLGYAKQMAAQQFAQYGMTNMGEDVFEGYAKRILADEKNRRAIADNVADFKLFNAVKAQVKLEPKEVTLDEFKTIVEEAQKA